MKYVFGPVPSRRLGFSLGVDLLPYKTCSFDCIYCELGPTTCRTLEPRDLIPPEAVLAELDDYLATTIQRIDYLTISGSGEPTLHPELGYLIRAIKEKYPQPLALITNGSLFFDPRILERVKEADLIIPSLDTVDPEAFQVINRPHPELRLEAIIEGLILLGQLPGPRIWLEVLFLRGLNDQPAQIEALSRTIERINPEKVQINTVVRPPVEGFAQAVDYRGLEAIRGIFRTPGRNHRFTHGKSGFSNGNAGIRDLGPGSQKALHGRGPLPPDRSFPPTDLGPVESFIKSAENRSRRF